jgi:CRISPR-associated endonuclease Cas1
MYKERIPDTIFPTGDLTLSQLRGIEGAHVRSTYGELSKQYGVTSFRRQARNANDPVNKGLTACNAMLYGLANAVCSTLSLNPALGVIHEGNSRSFLFDLADIYKMETSFAVSFEFGRNGGLPVIKKEMIYNSAASIQPSIKQTKSERWVPIDFDGVTLFGKVNKETLSPYKKF